MYIFHFISRQNHHHLILHNERSKLFKRKVASNEFPIILVLCRDTLACVEFIMPPCMNITSITSNHVAYLIFFQKIRINKESWCASVLS